MNAPRIVVIGSVNTDMVVKGRRLPAPGETVTGGRFFLAPGGKGANQAVAAARLGARVTLVAKVGRDMFGDQAVANFQQEGIDTDAILRDPQQPTGVALILVDDQGENLIAVASGANHALTPQEIEQLAGLIGGADLVMLQLEVPIDAVAAAARLAAAAGVPVVLNPAPAAPLPDALLPHVTYLTPNESEAQQLTGIRVQDESSARQAAERLLAAGAAHVVITLGAKGALLADAGRVLLVPSPTVEALDTTAAGDAFCGGLAWALGQGLPLPQAVRQACLVGALSVTRLGAQPSLPTRDELERFCQTLPGRG
ncbi:MAG: ribokinase [Thermoguttaceae bacterium]|jgi:ribokinase